ncbi:cation diffusion facilitator family transporter [Granulicella aggregans]|uniref:Cation diffusion facilitator family transporter n=1 Tax=Granulicella aggregans TaxID=474949 RepID=A0A7W8E236_9BACT|nr:cation diffusion facilitator family transporter [Granulicella aggregans]MBB5055774.1 cation diffusion facilitator family transporter [Granulicella aggregans]
MEVAAPDKLAPKPPATSPDSERASHKRSAALASVIAALGITILKLVTGLLTGSLGMLSEAAHSGIDCVAAALTLFSVQVSDRPADADHNYGHGKVESLSAFVETGLMLASCLWIIAEALRRIIAREHLAVTLSIWPFLVLILSIAVDFTRSRNLRKVARQYGSEALEADALHFGTDIWSSFAVLLGLAATAAGEHYHLPWLEFADPIAALVVSVIIAKVCWHLATQTVDALLDATPADASGQTRREVRDGLIRDLAAIDGVLTVDRVRTRRSGSSYFADLTLGMPRNLTFQRSEQITMAATEAVQRVLPGADVVVHSVPTASLAESVHDRIRAVAARANLNIHDVSVQQYDGALRVEQHLEVDETMTLSAAHALVTQLEAEMRKEIPAIATILTHIESEPATIERPASLDRDRLLENRLRNVATEFPEILDVHDVIVTRLSDNSSHADSASPHPGRLQVTCHCTLPDDLPMSRVHTIITALENAFKLDSPEVSRLLIHPEPATDNQR